MPIEDLDEYKQNEQLAVQNKNVFAQNNTVIAGFTVKHPLYDCRLLVIGFTDYCPCDQENTKVEGMRFIRPDSALYDKIFPKIIIDLRQNENKNFLGRKWDKNFNYYYYESITDKWAAHGCNIIYAVCKYRENGITKHAFLSLHEITPDI